MATISINIPNDKVTDLAAAIESAWGREQTGVDENGNPVFETDADMAKRHILKHLQKVYTWHMGQIAKAQAEVDAADDINIT